MLLIFFRYFSWALSSLKNGKRPLMNYFKMMSGKQIYGVLYNLYNFLNLLFAFVMKEFKFQVHLLEELVLEPLVAVLKENFADIK